MECCVIAGGDPDVAYLGLSLSRGTALGLAPMSKHGDRLIRSVVVIGWNAVDQVTRVGAPGLRSATSVGDAFVVFKSDIARNVATSKLVILGGNGDQFEREAKSVADAATENTLVICFRKGVAHFELTKSIFKLSKASLMFACATWSTNMVGNALVQTSHGSIICQRVPRGVTDIHLQLEAFEGCALDISYRSADYISNWAFGSMLFHLFDAYAALVHSDSEVRDAGSSLYEMLCSNERHRLVYAKLIEEGLCAVSQDEALRIDSTGSPFGIGFHALIYLCRLPGPLFKIASSLAMVFMGWQSTVAGGRHGSERSIADIHDINGLIVERNAKAGFEAPLNALLLKKSSTPDRQGFTEDDLTSCQLPQILNLPISLILVLIGAMVPLSIPFVVYMIYVVSLW